MRGKGFTILIFFLFEFHICRIAIGIIIIDSYIDFVNVNVIIVSPILQLLEMLLSHGCQIGNIPEPSIGIPRACVRVGCKWFIFGAFLCLFFVLSFVSLAFVFIFFFCYLFLIVCLISFTAFFYIISIGFDISCYFFFFIAIIDNGYNVGFIIGISISNSFGSIVIINGRSFLATIPVTDALVSRVILIVVDNDDFFCSIIIDISLYVFSDISIIIVVSIAVSIHAILSAAITIISGIIKRRAYLVHVGSEE
mmetsp:Transcript_22604/g.34458  ORF Transcript_22604/g.34458 Transcript_22604/m.34458 type:complete len:252 (-) Transcript_22604:218-973(-)